MIRLAASTVLMLSVSLPALAADWEEWPQSDMRGSYFHEPKDWSELGDTTDSLSFEAGLRYWYSIGAQNFDLGGTVDAVETGDTAHTGEVHLRIDDHTSRSYVKGLAGYSMAIAGDYTTSGGFGSISDGQIGYAGADFGWYAFGDDQGSGLGGLIGYQYWNDSPRTARDNYAVVSTDADIGFDPDTGVWSVPADGVERNLEVHALRLGLTAKAKLGDHFDISAELAAVPYATINGDVGGLSPGDFGPFPGCLIGDPCPPVTFTTSPISVEGHAYGAMAELMAGIHPTENLTVRLGGRAWYLTGSYDATFSAVDIAPPLENAAPPPNYSDPTIVSADDYIITNNPFSLLRYGLLAELTYSF